MDFLMPEIGDGMDGGEIVSWSVEIGQVVEEDQELVEIQTDKAIVSIPCPTSGVVTELRGGEGDVIAVGDVLAVFEVDGEGPRKPSVPADGDSAPPVPGKALASPAVRKRARELGIDLAEVKGSGPAGRVTRQDLEQHGGPEDRTADDQPGSRGGQPDGDAVPAGFGAATDRDSIVEPLRGIRRSIAQNMSRSWREIPHMVGFREVDAAALMDLRRKIKDALDAEGDAAAASFTPYALLAKFAVHALRRYPSLNASLDMEREEITRHRAVHLSVPIATPDGLVVPVVRDADLKSARTIALEIARLGEDAKERNLHPDQLRGGTFTVNNFGALRSPMGVSIIAPGQAANLGLGRIEDRPLARDGEVVVRKALWLCCSADHRILDGDTQAAYLDEVASMIEDPQRMIAELH